MCLGVPGTRQTAAAATSKTMKDKAAAAKSKTAAKDKEREKHSESIDAQFNMAMPHWTLRVVSDADVAVSSDLQIKFSNVF